MKNILYIIIILLICNSCSIKENDYSIDYIEKQSMHKHKITQNQAINLVNSLTNKGTRVYNKNYEIDYIIGNKHLTRSNINNNDTLAYILNSINNDGFFIISADDRVFPILAYSDEGNLSYEENENDIVYANFISYLDEYMSEISDSDTSVYVPEDILDGALIAPKLSTTWSQGAPFNQYVIEDYPGCPVGCVAVATGQIMTCCKPQLLNYHGLTWYLKSIDKAFKAGPDSVDYTPYNNYPIYTYTTAVDKAALLLYNIGIDVDMDYSPNGSVANSNDAYQLLDNLNFTIQENGLTPYNPYAIVQSFRANNIIYMRGQDPEMSIGHAWVADGCLYVMKEYTDGTEELVAALIHCNWGWGGENDGYFSGSVFEVAGKNYSGMTYFSVRKE